jgi:hypothetical protein
MIPRAYFNFLQNGASALLKGVFTHNVYDVVSLAALTVCACDRMATEPAALDDPLDLYSLARILENTSDWKRSLTLYEMALSGDMPDATRLRAEENLAVLCRRAGEHARAAAICERIMRHSEFSLVAYEGAAIYHERVAEDPSRALEIVEDGLQRLEAEAVNKKWRRLLEARRERLRQKAIQFC